MRQLLGNAIRDNKLKNNLKFDIQRTLLTSDLVKDKNAHLDIDLADYPQITDSNQIFEIGHQLNIAMKITDNHVLVFYNRPAKESNSLIDKKYKRLLKLLKHNRIFSNLQLGGIGLMAACLLIVMIASCFKMNIVELWVDLISIVIVILAGFVAVIFCLVEIFNDHHIRVEFNKQIKNSKKK